MSSLHLHRRHVDQIASLVTYDSLIREILLKVVLVKEAFPILRVLKIEINKAWIIKLLDISPNVVLAYDTPYISKLTNSIIRILLHTLTGREATHRLDLFSSIKVSFSLDWVPELYVVSKSVSS